MTSGKKKREIPYVQFVGSQQVPPPYHFPGVTAHGFVWEAKMDAIQAYCDRNLNLGREEDRGFVYKPAPFWPYILMMCIDYPVMMSSDARARARPGRPRYADRGTVAQKEVFIGFPLIRYGTSPTTRLRNTAIEWALPFIVVENAMSAVSGREMLGLEKLLADIVLEENRLPNSFSARVRLPGWEKKEDERKKAEAENGEGEDGKQDEQEALTAEEEEKIRREAPIFLEANTGSAFPTFRGAGAAKSLYSLFRTEAAGGLIEGLGSAVDFIGSISEDLVPTAMRTVALKQIRDASEPSKAVHQSLVGCRAKYSRIHDFHFFNEQDSYVNFYPDDSFSQLLDLFLPCPVVTGERKPNKQLRHKKHLVKWFRPRAAFGFKADIDFDEMRTLHTFTADGNEAPLPGDPTAAWLRPWRGLFAGEAS